LASKYNKVELMSDPYLGEMVAFAMHRTAGHCVKVRRCPLRKTSLVCRLGVTCGRHGGSGFTLPNPRCAARSIPARCTTLRRRTPRWRRSTPRQGTAFGQDRPGQPFSLRNPYLGMNFAIALQGVFPPRP